MSSNSRYFSSVNGSRMGSNAYTDVNQGGGNKKAGFPSLIGRGSWTSIAYGTCNPKKDPLVCCTLSKMNTLRFTQKVNQNLPIGGHSSVQMR